MINILCETFNDISNLKMKKIINLDQYNIACKKLNKLVYKQKLVQDQIDYFESIIFNYELINKTKQ